MSAVSALLIEAPVGRHFAQFHRDTDGLNLSVGQFVETGLRRRNGVLVVASAPTVESLMARLGQSGLDPEGLGRSGQLTILDADATLRHLIRGETPDWPAFRSTIGGALEGMNAFGRSTLRVYGELVDVLWRQGRPEAAIRLEEYWNELARVHPFSLFCSYMLDSHQAECYAGPVHEIGRTHTDVIVSEDDERFRVALDAASRDVFGVSLARMLSLSGQEDHPGEHRLPSGQRTMLWIMRNMPGSSADILERARRYYDRA